MKEEAIIEAGNIIKGAINSRRKKPKGFPKKKLKESEVKSKECK